MSVDMINYNPLEQFEVYSSLNLSDNFLAVTNIGIFLSLSLITLCVMIMMLYNNVNKLSIKPSR
jgi:hypothetical protein